MLELISNSMLLGFLTGLVFISMPTAMLQAHLAPRSRAGADNGNGSFRA